jgi:hypothetical protein
MKRAGAAAIALAIMVIVFSRSVWGSGYHPPMAAFGAQDQPDPPLDRFAAGRLGLIQPGWGTTYLYVAYRYLAGPGFDPEEQKVLLSLWNEKSGTPSEPNPQSDWLAARSKIPVAPAMQEIDHFAPGPGYSFFGNCNDDAFRTASATLQSIVAKFGTSSPQVKQLAQRSGYGLPKLSGFKEKPAHSAAVEWRLAIRAGSARISNRVGQLLRREFRHRCRHVHRDCARFDVAMVDDRALPGGQSNNQKGHFIW